MERKKRKKRKKVKRSNESQSSKRLSFYEKERWQIHFDEA